MYCKQFVFIQLYALKIKVHTDTLSQRFNKKLQFFHLFTHYLQQKEKQIYSKILCLFLI